MKSEATSGNTSPPPAHYDESDIEMKSDNIEILNAFGKGEEE